MRFIKGNVERVAEDAAKIEKLKADGYKVIAGDLPKEVVVETVDLTAMTVDQLKELAREKGKKDFQS